MKKKFFYLVVLLLLGAVNIFAQAKIKVSELVGTTWECVTISGEKYVYEFTKDYMVWTYWNNGNPNVHKYKYYLSSNVPSHYKRPKAYKQNTGCYIVIQSLKWGKEQFDYYQIKFFDKKEGKMVLVSPRSAYWMRNENVITKYKRIKNSDKIYSKI